MRRLVLQFAFFFYMRNIVYRFRKEKGTNVCWLRYSVQAYQVPNIYALYFSFNLIWVLVSPFYKGKHWNLETNLKITATQESITFSLPVSRLSSWYFSYCFHVIITSFLWGRFYSSCKWRRVLTWVYKE